MKQKNFLEKIIKWAESDESVRIIIKTGSFARNDKSSDELSDIDLEVFVNNFEKYTFSNNWIKEIQEYWIIFPLVNDVGDPTRLVIFNDGTKVDFSLNKIQDFEKMVSDQPQSDRFNKGYKVLIDKDNMTKNLIPPSFKIKNTKKPSQQEFTALVEEFWFEAYHIPKYLKRKSLWTVKFRDWTMKQLLLRMIEWYEKSIHGWDYDTWFNGVNMEKWIEKDLLGEINSIFAHFDLVDSWKALENTTKLFRRTAKETAKNVKYTYPDEADINISRFIESPKK